MACHGQPDLLENEKCVDWLTDHCQDESSGMGYCHDFRNYVKEMCKAGKDGACKIAQEVGENEDSDGEEEEKAEENVEEDKEEEQPPKPVMTIPEALRAMACSGQPDLVENEKCVAWLIDHCKD